MGVPIPNIQIQNPFKIQMSWCSDLGWFTITMIGTIAIASYSPDHSKTEPVHRNPRWQLFGQIQNGWAVRFWNSIPHQNHLTSEQPSTIQNPSVFGIWAPTVHTLKVGQTTKICRWEKQQNCFYISIWSSLFTWRRRFSTSSDDAAAAEGFVRQGSGASSSSTWIRIFWKIKKIYPI